MEEDGRTRSLVQIRRYAVSTDLERKWTCQRVLDERWKGGVAALNEVSPRSRWSSHHGTKKATRWSPGPKLGGVRQKVPHESSRYV
ncbi:hypothetical protein HAX54_016613 [Datura stramonium]|uniref:Uncharacterized protein n=1 Tax=Datura stramonium TaxID=4076 RepID=A0ABS8UJ50_DATST|nr:hypothetical protein [Datura stramonium]